MFQFNVNDISKYRTQLMGIVTLLVIFGHSGWQWCCDAKVDGVALRDCLRRSGYLPSRERLGPLVFIKKY